MANLNESLKEAVCIEEEVFFGPIADKERKIRNHFENVLMNENKTVESCVEKNDISKNDSLYQSFSVEESKYESFDDSLNEEPDKKPHEAKHITLRKNFDKLKAKRHAFYDSLEDVCSLVSNIDKCSISCELENNSNLNNKHAIEDSLMNPPVVPPNKSYGVSEQDSLKNSPAVGVLNKSHGVSEQVHFDDDSLAILELENTFDDSLEEINVLSSVEIEEVGCIEDMSNENQNMVLKVEQNPEFVSRNLFDTSVQVICEKKKVSDLVDQEESSGDKNLLYDSLSNSDFKDILKDSLEESEKCCENLNFLKYVSDNVLSSVEIKEIEDMSAENQNMVLKVEQNPEFVPRNLFDASVQIICEKKKVSNLVDQEESSDDKNLLYDSLSNSDFKDILKDSLEESEKCCENLKFLKQVVDVATNSTQKPERAFTCENVLDSSVQIVYENFQNSCHRRNTSEITNSDCNDLSKDSLEIYKQVNKDIIEQTNTKAGKKYDSFCINFPNENEAASQKLSESYFTDANANALSNDSCANQDLNEVKDCSVLTESVIPVIDHSSHKETIIVDSCHLKLLSDDMNIDKDLKFQLQMEVTVGDKKCQIASENVKIVPTSNVSLKKTENVILRIPTDCSSANNIIDKKDVLDKCNLKLHSDVTGNATGKNISDAISNVEVESVNVTNDTQRTKSSGPQFVIDSEEKLKLFESLNDISLFQALDLHDVSASLLNESVLQSKDSLMPLNLCSRDQDLYAYMKDETKENIPQLVFKKKKDSCTKTKKETPNKVCNSKTPKSAQKIPKDLTKKNSGTKIPVRKIENFAVPIVTPNKFPKQVQATLSAEKNKKCQHSPHSAEVGKKTPVTTPNKTPHFCKVRNTIFSKVPQIVPSKKYVNIQSPVAQYIKNNHGCGKTPYFDPVLRDCMNRPLESPYHAHHTPKSGTLKPTKKKA